MKKMKGYEILEKFKGELSDVEVEELKKRMNKNFLVLSERDGDVWFDYYDGFNEDYIGAHCVFFDYGENIYFVATDGIDYNFGSVFYIEIEDENAYKSYFVDEEELLSYAEKYGCSFEDVVKLLREGKFKVYLDEYDGVKIVLDDFDIEINFYFRDGDIVLLDESEAIESFVEEYRCTIKNALKEWFYEHLIKENAEGYKIATQWNGYSVAVVEDDGGKHFLCKAFIDATANCYHGGFSLEIIEELDENEIEEINLDEYF